MEQAVVLLSDGSWIRIEVGKIRSNRQIGTIGSQLRKTRVRYLDAQKSFVLAKYNISVISNELTIEEKRVLIEKRIRYLWG